VELMKVPDRTGGTTMWDTVQTNSQHLSHDLPCQHCGHASHTYLACSDNCACVPSLPPGVYAQDFNEQYAA